MLALARETRSDDHFRCARNGVRSRAGLRGNRSLDFSTENDAAGKDWLAKLATSFGASKIAL
jgi:hypothetical protein